MIVSLKDSASDLKQQKFDLAKLTRVTNMPLKSLLSSKVAEAFDKGIQCHVEVEEGVFFTDSACSRLDYNHIHSL